MWTYLTHCCLRGIISWQISQVKLQHWQRNNRTADKRGKSTKPNKGLSLKGCRKRKAKQAKTTFRKEKAPQKSSFALCQSGKVEYHQLFATGWYLFSFSSLTNSTCNHKPRALKHLGHAVPDVCTCQRDWWKLPPCR